MSGIAINQATPMGRIGVICARFHSGSAEVRMILQRPCATWSALARCVERLGAVLACVDGPWLGNSGVTGASKE